MPCQKLDRHFLELDVECPCRPEVEYDERWRILWPCPANEGKCVHPVGVNLFPVGTAQGRQACFEDDQLPVPREQSGVIFERDGRGVVVRRVSGTKLVSGEDQWN